MKAVFLDIDGVLNTDFTKVVVPRTGFRGTEEALVTRWLKWIVTKKDVTVVLSSSWRTHDVMKRYLAEQGVTWNYETPNFNGMGGRGREIEAWMNTNPVTHAVIFDDMHDLRPMNSFLVQTSRVTGLQDRHLHRANGLLDK